MTKQEQRQAKQQANREAAMAAVIAKKTEIDALLARITAASEDHFGASPDTVTWADADTLAAAAQTLKDLARFLNV